jgi:hypothetical protein
MTLMYRDELCEQPRQRSTDHGRQRVDHMKGCLKQESLRKMSVSAGVATTASFATFEGSKGGIDRILSCAHPQPALSWR